MRQKDRGLVLWNTGERGRHVGHPSQQVINTGQPDAVSPAFKRNRLVSQNRNLGLVQRVNDASRIRCSVVIAEDRVVRPYDSTQDAGTGFATRNDLTHRQGSIKKWDGNEITSQNREIGAKTINDCDRLPNGNRRVMVLVVKIT